MRIHKRAFALLLSLLLLTLAPAGLSEGEGGSGFSAKGLIEAPRAITLQAPMGGRVENFAWQAGDRVEQGELAVSLLAGLLYAPSDGVVAALRARPGDLAQHVAAQFGALCYINRDHLWQIDGLITSTSGDEETRDVRIGQTLRVQHGTGDSKVKGTGTVIAREQNRFVLELDKGDFELEDSVNIYLGSSKDNARADQIGTGKIRQAQQLPVMGEGMVAAVLTGEGEQVRRGQPLFIVDSADARYSEEEEASPELRFPQAGIIAEVLTSPGMYVRQGQGLMRLVPDGALTAAVEVDELDIARVRVGESVRVTVDAYGTERQGTVTQIEPLGRVVLDTTKFVVKIAFEKTDDLMIGMHVRAWWD